MSSDSSPTSRQRIAGLDAIRFVAASWVVLHHIGPWPGADVKTAWQTGLHLLFNGPAAVTVFFVISGFVIHHPFVHRPLGNPVPFWAQRWIRISLPAAVMTVLMFRFRFLGIRMPWDGFQLTPLGHGLGFRDTSGLMWSLVAEVVYYGLYPFLRPVGMRIGWWRLAGLALVPALALLLWQPRALLFNNFTHWMAWILGLPSWLAGCALAQTVATESPATASRGGGRVGLWRIAILLGAWLTAVLKEHTWSELPQIGYPWTLQLFAILVVGWVRAEILQAARRPGPAWLEWNGRWSYSIYLTHMAALTFWLGVVGGPDLPGAPWIGAFARMAAIFGLCFLFYLTVEWPSWQVARWAGRRLRLNRVVAPPQPA